MKMNEKQAALAAALKNAGLGGVALEQFMLLAQQGTGSAGQIKILRRHRLGLLEEIHRRQKSLDLIDYLIYKLKEGARRGQYDD